MSILNVCVNMKSPRLFSFLTLYRSTNNYKEAMKAILNSVLLFISVTVFPLHAFESICTDGVAWQLGADYTWAHISTGDIPSFNGSLGGIQGSIEYFGNHGFYGALQGKLKGGTTRNRNTNRDLLYFDIQERLGATSLFLGGEFSFTLFTGVGYRHLGHRWKDEGFPSVKFNYDDIYLPVGVLSEYGLCYYDFLTTTVGLNIIWMPDLYPTVEIVPLKGARWILQHRYDHFLVEAPITMWLNELTSYIVTLKPFYEHWSDGRSTARTNSGLTFGLPANHYNFFGIELNLSAEF
jgi:hypothetical protein